MPAPTPEDRQAARLRPSVPAVMAMDWENLLFLHWSWDPVAIQRTLPAGLQVDIWEGRAWLGIVPFFMRRVRPAFLPSFPFLSDFLELNVRTYVYDRTGTPGVWFYSLSCNRYLAVWGARHFFHLNYVQARMFAFRQLRGISYTMARPGIPPARFVYRPGGAFAPPLGETLEFFLVERYLLYAADPAGRLHRARIHHRPYELAPAHLPVWSFAPAEADGFAAPGRPPDHAAVSRNMAVKGWWIEPICER